MFLSLVLFNRVETELTLVIAMILVVLFDLPLGDGFVVKVSLGLFLLLEQLFVFMFWVNGGGVALRDAGQTEHGTAGRVRGPPEKVTRRAVAVEVGVEVGGVRVGFLVDWESSEPSRSFDVTLLTHPFDRPHVEVLDIALTATTRLRNTVLGDPDGQSKRIVNARDPLGKLVKVLPTSVPVQRDKADVASEFLALAHKLLEPLHVPAHLWRTDLNALVGERLQLLHPQFGRSLGSQVGLTLNIRLVKSEQVLGKRTLRDF